MKKSATLWFGIGCSTLVFSAMLQLVFPGFLPFILIILAVGICNWQWYRRTRDLKKQISREQTIRLAADRYINARFK
jgi:uncharacterized membrane protein YesL